jgi:hypothetical protein
MKSKINHKYSVSSSFMVVGKIKPPELGNSTPPLTDFAAALKRGDAKDEAEANINLAESFEVGFTPTLIINGNLKIDPSLTNYPKLSRHTSGQQ